MAKAPFLALRAVGMSLASDPLHPNGVQGACGKAHPQAPLGCWGWLTCLLTRSSLIRILNLSFRTMGLGQRGPKRKSLLIC